MKEPNATRAETVRPGHDRYSTFLSLSGDAIARFDLDRPLRADASEDEQVEHILRHSRVAECNELFARFYGRSIAEMRGLAMGDFVPSDDPGRLHGIRQFIRSGFRMVYVEEEHTLGPGSSRWLSASALGVVEEGGLHDFWVCLRDVTDRKQGELERERRGNILEAVAFSAARLLRAGSWRAQVDEVLARLGYAAGAARVWLAEFEGSSEEMRFVFRSAWSAPGVGSGLDDPKVMGGVVVKQAGLERLLSDLRAGRPVVTLVKALSVAEQALPSRMGSQAFAAVPVFVNDRPWGFLGFGETRYEREWSSPEVEALKAAAAVFGAALERERADAALRESEERFKRLAAATFEGIALTENGLFLDANDQLAEMLGCSTPDLIGRPVEEFVVADDHELVSQHRQSGFEGPYQHRARRRDGRVLPVEVRARQTPYQGRTVRVTAIRDVSARVQAEELQRSLEGELRQAAEQWRQTFDALDLGIVLADAEGCIVRLNRGALELAAGPSFTDAVGHNLTELSDHEPWRTILGLHEQVGRQGISVGAETRDPSTGRAFYLLGSPWKRGEGERPWRVITFRDVTDFLSIQKQLRQARLMEAMGSLVAGVAHEVRNPLFSISASVDALEAEMGPRPEFAEYATLLRAQVNRLTQLMRDLLDYGKPSVLRRAPTSVAEVVRRAGRACATLARDRKITVEEHAPSDIPALDLDGARLEQALENLLANAIQHAPAASVVRIRAELDATGPEPRVRCIVEDEGPGLPAEPERLFEPFFTRRKGGTGLGLPIVERVVTAHGGRVTAENREGGGARFTVHLPAGPPLERSGPA